MAVKSMKSGLFSRFGRKVENMNTLSDGSKNKQVASTGSSPKSGTDGFSTDNSEPASPVSLNSAASPEKEDFPQDAERPGSKSPGVRMTAIKEKPASAVSRPGSRLSISMLSASNLRAADFGMGTSGGGKSDPYCCCQLRGQPATKVQTKKMPKTLAPVWNETHEIKDYEWGDVLDFSVYDHDTGSAPDLLGKVSLRCEDFDKEGGYEGVLELTETGKKSASSTLTVKVVMLQVTKERVSIQSIPETPEVEKQPRSPEAEDELDAQVRESHKKQEKLEGELKALRQQHSHLLREHRILQEDYDVVTNDLPPPPAGRLAPHPQRKKSKPRKAPQSPASHGGTSEASRDGHDELSTAEDGGNDENLEYGADSPAMRDRLEQNEIMGRRGSRSSLLRNTESNRPIYNLHSGNNQQSTYVGGGGKKGSPAPANHTAYAVDVDLYKMAEPLMSSSRYSKRAKERAISRIQLCLYMQKTSCDTWYGPGTPLSGSVQSRSVEFAKAVLDAKASPNEVDDKSVAVLHLAAFDGQENMCKLLLEKQADPNLQDRFGQTPLFFAQKASICEELVRGKADVNTVNMRGQSAVHLAAQALLMDVVLWHTTHTSKAMLRMRDEQGQTAMDFLVAGGVRQEILWKLRAAFGAQTVYSNRQPGTPHSGRAAHVGFYPKLPGQDSDYSDNEEEEQYVQKREEEDNAATMIQANFRGSFSRRNSKSYQDELPSDLQRGSREQRERQRELAMRHLQQLKVGSMLPGPVGGRLGSKRPIGHHPKGDPQRPR